MTTIDLKCYGIIVTLVGDGGTITSNLKDGDSGTKGDDVEYDAAIDGIESLILAHACAGVDITTPAYLQGIETAVQAFANNL